VLARDKFQVRQGSYHTWTFGDRFIKVSLTAPREWLGEFCALLPAAIEQAWGFNEPAELY
jgi:hypothetical protein